MDESVVPDEDEHLITGWEPELPEADTLVRQAVLVHASWPVAVARSTGRPCRSEDRWAGAWIGDRGALTNPVVLKQPFLDPAAVVAEVAALIPPQVPYFMISPWSTIDLSTHDLLLLGHPPLMARFPRVVDPPERPGVEVREVDDADELAVAERILVEGYPMPDLQPLTPGDLLGEAILGSTTRVWVGKVDGEPASVAAAHMHGGVTLVEYVATLPSARGRGAGAAVTWAATLAEPASTAVLIASDDGRPVYERMGYQAIERWTAWLRPAT